MAAVFLVVGLASLGAFILTISNAQQLTSAQDVQGSRAFWAARAGLEWGIAGARGGSCPASTSIATIDSTFTVTVTCVLTTYTTDAGFTSGVSPKIYQISAVARTSGSVGSVGYIERSVSTAMEM